MTSFDPYALKMVTSYLSINAVVLTHHHLRTFRCLGDRAAASCLMVLSESNFRNSMMVHKVAWLLDAAFSYPHCISHPLDRVPVLGLFLLEKLMKTASDLPAEVHKSAIRVRTKLEEILALSQLHAPVTTNTTPRLGYSTAPSLTTASLSQETILSLIGHLETALLQAGIRFLVVEYGWGCLVRRDRMWSGVITPATQLLEFVRRAMDEQVYRPAVSDLIVCDEQYRHQLFFCHEAHLHIKSPEPLMLQRMEGLLTSAGIEYSRDPGVAGS